MTVTQRYVGRFAPSPSGPLHLGSVVTALASFLDARSHGGKWLVRIEDIDEPRTEPGAEQIILQQLHALGMMADEPIWHQSSAGRQERYRQVFTRWRDQGRVYGCACTRRDLQRVAVNELGERPYPGICRTGLPFGRQPRSWRFWVPNDATVNFVDRWFGPQEQQVFNAVGDFVLRRSDGYFAYQLAVVVDDIDQGVTDVVRGADLLSSTARQFLLWDLLAARRPRMMHVPLLRTADGRKLSKQNHAPPVNIEQPLAVLQAAWQALGFEPFPADAVSAFQQEAIVRWREQFGPAAG